MASKRLVIGLDFGTTYSAIAYSDSENATNDANAVQLFTAWPGVAGGGHDRSKVPSRICYGVPPENAIEWGYKIKPTTKGKVHALMKLELDEKHRKSKPLQLLTALLAGRFEGLELDGLADEDMLPPYPGKRPVDVVADYLSEMRQHFYGALKNKYGEVLLSTLRKELIVTVPAVWSERAKDLTLKAVMNAGFDAASLAMVTEPEAAAVYTLRGMVDGVHKEEVNVGDHFVLCDAGGGTVDLISYRITQTSPVFRIEEAAIGSGDKCGGSYVQQAFLSWLKTWIGEEAMKQIPTEKTLTGSQLMTSFETLKQHFSGEEDDMEIRLPRECGIDNDKDKNIEDLVLTITNDQMKSFFDPCVNRALELIDGQVDAVMKRHGTKPKMVLVVGGFGKNEYLFSRIKEYTDARGIISRQPESPWGAIVRGAVLRGLEGPQGGVIAVRLARKHYGTYTSAPFIEGVHHPDDAYIDRFSGRRYCKGIMTWLVERGARLPEATFKVASIEVGCKFRRNEDREFGAILVGCDEAIPPRRYADKSTYNICKVVADLSVVPDHKFMKLSNGVRGEEYWMAEFRLEAKFEGGTITWSFVFDGKVYSNVTVSYND